MNLGYQWFPSSEGVDVKIYYDKTWLEVDPTRNPDDAPLIDGPRGYCVDLTNTSGRNVKVTVNGLGGVAQVITVGQGDPVTTGPANGRSRTAAQMATLGFTTRGNLGSVSVG